jgi:hypothetical protein
MFKKYAVFETGTLVTNTALQSFNTHVSSVVFFFLLVCKAPEFNLYYTLLNNDLQQHCPLTTAFFSPSLPEFTEQSLLFKSR